MDTNDPQIEQPGSCDDSSSGGDESCSSASGGQSNWKTAVFVAVLILAGVVAGRSILLKNGGNGGSPCGSQMGSLCCPLTATQSDIAAKTCPQTAACASEAVCPKTGACPMEKAGCPSEGNPPAGCPKAALSSCCPDQGNGESTEAGCCPDQGNGESVEAGCCPNQGNGESTEAKAPEPGCCPGDIVN